MAVRLAPITLDDGLLRFVLFPIYFNVFDVAYMGNFGKGCAGGEGDPVYWVAGVGGDFGAVDRGESLGLEAV